MNPFLDRQTIIHKNFDDIPRKLVYPDKKKFFKIIEMTLGERIYENKDINDIFKRIKPEFDEHTLDQTTKQYAKHYCDLIRTRINSHNKYFNDNCVLPSIDLPEIDINDELKGRL